jgi:hypothetical protein
VRIKSPYRVQCRLFKQNSVICGFDGVNDGIEGMLTPEELRFLSSQGISPSDVFDGRYSQKKQAAEEAKKLGKRLVLGSPCNNGGHRLRTRSGHCVQCDTKKIAYEGRYSKSGYVYIMGSISGRLIKIGTTTNLKSRLSSVGAEAYGGFADWELLMSVKVPEAGKVEQTAIHSLGRHGVKRKYIKDNSPQTASELLECSFTQALVAIVDAINGGESAEAWRSPRWKLYDFTKVNP